MSCVRQTRRRTYLQNDMRKPNNVKKDSLVHGVSRKPILRDRTNIARPIKEACVLRKELVPKVENDHIKNVDQVVDVSLEEQENAVNSSDLESMEVDLISNNVSDQSWCDDFEQHESEHADTVVFVSNYVKMIYTYLRSYENQFLLADDFIVRHNDITPRMRYILVDWLSKVHLKFELSADCFHLTILILDRYLNLCRSVTKNSLQLYGTTALLIASKIEEVYPPSVSDLSFVTENAVSCQDILTAEVDVLTTLSFDLNIPLPLHFYRRLSHICHFTTEQHSMGKYLLELCLVEYELCHYRPSKLAAVVTLLVRIMFSGSLPWTRMLQRHCKYSQEELMPLAQKLARNLLRHTQPSKYRAIRDKYSTSSNCHVSLSPCISCDAVVRIAHASQSVENDRILVPLVMANSEGRFYPLFFNENSCKISDDLEPPENQMNQRAKKPLIISDPPTPLLLSGQDDLFGGELNTIFPGDS